MQNIVILFCTLPLLIYQVSSQTSCQTPNKEQARCIPIKSCKILYDAVLSNDPEVVRFLRASQCGFSRTPLVCCGSTASYAPKPTPRPLVPRPDLLPDLNSCGDRIETRIYNGTDTELNEFPWTALIRYRSPIGAEDFSCGASLINDRYVLTAAHCVQGAILTAVGRPVSVRLGEWNTETENDCTTTALGQRICVPDKPVDLGIEEIVAHEDYTDAPTDKSNDIALIRLNRKIQYTDFIKPVCLPQPSDEVKIGHRLIVVGWGRTENGKYSAIKQKLAVPIVSSSQCETVYRSRFGSFNVKNTQLCAGGEKGRDSCSGDSGGPLMIERTNGQMFLEGVVSFGYECGLERWPGVYTRVSQFRNWIEGNLRD